MKFHIFTNIRFAVCKFYIVQLIVNSQARENILYLGCDPDRSLNQAGGSD